MTTTTINNPDDRLGATIRRFDQLAYEAEAGTPPANFDALHRQFVRAALARDLGRMQAIADELAAAL